jgi:AbrB family looped-hinge helix DNA binding protein
MPKVTSKLQLTVPKKIADQYGIRPGDELEWIAAGDSIRVELVRRKAKAGHELTAEERVALFDANMKWLDKLQAGQLREAKAKGTRVTRENRGWTREELYNDERGLPRGFPRRH